jgi:hypothetical protein
MKELAARAGQLLCGVCGIVLLACAPVRANAPPTTQPTETSARQNTEGAPPLNPSMVPPRPPPLIELGDKFFGTGPLQHGIQLPTGAVWTPDFTVFGTLRAAVQAFHNPANGNTYSEWANRLDVFANLQLSGTERLLVGFRPLDNAVFSTPQQAKYSGYQFSPAGTVGWVDGFKAEPTTLFFEGDVGQIFPKLDPMGTAPWDVGFSVGRQPLLYQDGLLVDDDLDAVGITRNTFLPRGGSNAQITGLYAWNQINRGDGVNHHDHLLLGLAINADFRPTTWNLEFFYVDSDSQVPGGVYAALSATQRIGVLNTTFRVLGSLALGSEPPASVSQFGNGSEAVGSGVLLFSEMSYTLPYRTDLVYLDTFWGIDDFTSAARGPDRGGVLGRVGILYAEQPIGRFGSALSSNPQHALGFALGYQAFLGADRRKQLILEAGGRVGTASPSPTQMGIGAQYQQAFGQHIVTELMAFASLTDGQGPGYGARAELRFEF